MLLEMYVSVIDDRRLLLRKCTAMGIDCQEMCDLEVAVDLTALSMVSTCSNESNFLEICDFICVLYYT
jgi:hypothetical protein